LRLSFFISSLLGIEHVNNYDLLKLLDDIDEGNFEGLLLDEVMDPDNAEKSVTDCKNEVAIFLYKLIIPSKEFSLSRWRMFIYHIKGTIWPVMEPGYIKRSAAFASFFMMIFFWQSIWKYSYE